MKRLFPFAMLALSAWALPACSDNDTPDPVPASGPVDIYFDFNMKGMTSTTTVGTFGVASTEADAQAARPTVLGGTVSWAETNGGKQAKTFALPGRPRGEKLWVFLKSDAPLQTGQSLNLNWTVSNTATLTSASPTVQVSSFTIK